MTSSPGSGFLTAGLPNLPNGSITGAEKINMDTALPDGQQPQSAYLTTGQLGLGAGGQATLAAAGATQGNAAQISARNTIVTVSASTEGVKLPLAATGLQFTLFCPGTKGVKVYPNTNDKISTASTNAAVALVADKANIYRAQDATTWVVLRGA